MSIPTNAELRAWKAGAKVVPGSIVLILIAAVEELQAENKRLRKALNSDNDERPTEYGFPVSELGE